MRLIAYYSVCGLVGKQASLEGSAKSRSGIKVFDVGKNLVSDLWTADGNGMLPCWVRVLICFGC